MHRRDAWPPGLKNFSEQRSRRQREILSPGLARPATAGGSDPSGTAVTDTYLAAFHQHRHLAGSPGKAQHLLQGLGVLDDIPIDNGKTLFALGLPGLEGEGSGLLAEDGDLLSHGPPPQAESRKKTFT
jgi:hypothetical protein